MAISTVITTLAASSIDKFFLASRGFVNGDNSTDFWIGAQEDTPIWGVDNGFVCVSRGSSSFFFAWKVWLIMLLKIKKMNKIHEDQEAKAQKRLEGYYPEIKLKQVPR